jgi:2C-methyl-D-erythritol 2,4-cyclodiphosphate synthase
MALSEKTDADVLAVATPIMDNLMDASTQIDYERHVRDFTDRAKSTLTAERLRQICETYQRERGFFGERELLAILRRPRSVLLVWKQRFTKVPGQYLAEMILVEKDGRALVDHVMVL